jgi:hypothetical protein
MRMFVVGDCSPDRRYGLIDPTEPYEMEFENEVAKALSCVRPEYLCVPFHGTFEFEGRRFRPDLALVAKDGSHWFIIEVELLGHSLDLHVLPQVRAFRYGEWHEDCVTSLAKSLNLDEEHVRSIMEFIPRSVVVVTNKWAAKWEDQLLGLGVQLVTVSVFRGPDGTVAYEVDGALDVTLSNLGYGVYSATDRSIRMALGTDLEEGEIQLDEPTGGVSSWIVARTAEATWITKQRGVPAFDDGEYLQLLRTIEGKISLRPCRKR